MLSVPGILLHIGRRRLLFAPVAGIRLPPLPHPVGIFRSAKVVFVLLFARPSPLACRLGGLLTFRLPAMALPLAIAGFRNKLLAAMQALAGRFLFHRRAQIEPPRLRRNPASKKKFHAPHFPEQDEEQNEGRRALWEAIEENARAEESAFYTGQFIGFLYRRSHRLRAHARRRKRSIS